MDFGDPISPGLWSVWIAKRDMDARDLFILKQISGKLLDFEVSPDREFTSQLFAVIKQ